MPLHDYACPACDYQEIDVLESVSESRRTRHCPKCKARLYIRPSSFGMKFKGEGFYVNDYGQGKEGD
jgi:putative FmdB family regulatory protein